MEKGCKDTVFTTLNADKSCNGTIDRVTDRDSGFSVNSHFFHKMSSLINDPSYKGDVLVASSMIAIAKMGVNELLKIDENILDHFKPGVDHIFLLDSLIANEIRTSYADDRDANIRTIKVNGPLLASVGMMIDKHLVTDENQRRLYRPIINLVHNVRLNCGSSDMIDFRDKVQLAVDSGYYDVGEIFSDSSL